MAFGYQAGTKVRAKVTKAGDSGVWVRVLPDMLPGLIRRRELSWDRRVGVLPAIPAPGTHLDALIIEGDESRGMLYLSVRQVHDPWVTALAEGRYQVGDAVTGEVVNTRHGDAFVQIEPGIEAHVVRSAVPILAGQGMEDVIWVGDQVRGVITGINEAERWFELSIADELIRLAGSSDRGAAQFELFEPSWRAAHAGEPDAQTPPAPVHEYQPRPPIPRPQRMLVIDDDDHDRSDLCRWLNEAYALPADDGVRSSQEALDKLAADRTIGLAIIDLNLDGERGDQAAQHLRALVPGLPVIFVSLAFTADEQEALEAQGDPLIRKDRAEVLDWVDRLCTGYQRRIRARPEPRDTQIAEVIQQLGMDDFVREPVEERVHDILRALRQDIRIEHAAIVELNPTLRSVAVVAADPPLAPEVNERWVGVLYYSPVRDVIEYQQEYRYRADDPAERARSRNLFPGLAFGSAYGVPITIPGHETRRALFLFDARIAAFSKGVRRRMELIRAALQLLRATYENRLFLERVRRYQQQYTRGELLAGLIHELRHKINALVYPTATLQQFSKALNLPGPVDLDQWREDVQEAVSVVAELNGDLAELVTAYEHSATEILEPVDVNAMVQKTQRQLARLARSAGVTIHLDLTSGRLLARAVAPQLAQVLTNLVVNAVQQINLQTRVADYFAAEHDVSPRIARPGLIWLRTRLSTCPEGSVVIQVVDTGPGIHHLNYDRIFAMDFSTRGGAGLGLYISRSLIEMMGGSLDLSASLMLIGSSFAVQLPCSRPPEELANA